MTTRRTHEGRRTGELLLAIVAVGFAAMQLAALPVHVRFSWDEALYASQFSSSVPAMPLAAHRALGMPLVLAPVTALTTSVTTVRVYLTALSSAALFLAYRPWLAAGRWVAPIAALLFAGCSVTLVYAHLALPNTLAALCAVAGAGFFLRAVKARRAWGPLAGLFVAFAALSLIRPTDSVWVAIPLLCAVAAVRSWRRPGPAAAVVAGLSVGGLTWLAVAWARFGGPFSRLAAMSRTTAAGSDPIAAQWLRALAGWSWTGAIVLVIALAAVLGVAVLGIRSLPYASGHLLSVPCAAAVLLPYLLLLGYGSDRYLLPAYGLVMPVTAAAILRLGRLRWPGTRAAVGVALVLALAADLGAQFSSARGAGAAIVATHHYRLSYAEPLHRLGVRPPCVVSGSYAPQLAYALHCTAGDIKSATSTSGTRAAMTRRDLRTARTQHAVLVVMEHDGRRPRQLAGWRRVRLLADRSAYACLPPGTRL